MEELLTMNELLVMDVANVYLRDLESGKLIGTTTTSANSINATLEQDVLRAGWGGGVVASISSSKLVEISFTDVFFSMDYLALQQGSEVEENATGKVLQHFGATVEKDGADLKVTVPADVTATSAIFEDLDGSQNPVTITTNEITIPTGSEAKEGDEVRFFYEKEITGKRVSIDSAKFPKYVEVTMHTRGFNPDTNTVSQDIYAKLDKCQVGGNSTLELGVNTPVSTEITFTAMNKNKNSTELGSFWSVDRK